MPSAFPNLLSPLQVGPRTVRNRVLVTAHVPRLAENNMPSARYVAYHRARARGGAGMQITGATAVHPTGTLGTPYSLENLDDRIVPGYRELAAAVHDEGGTILAQLAHSGPTVATSAAGRPLWAPSDVASDLVREVPHEMTVAEIEEVVAAYGAAAARVRDGDMDGVEILAAFGFLVAAFLSPLSNKRTDAYGGTLDGRLRFAFEVIDAVRGHVGPDRIVGLRIPGDERVDGGLTLDDMTVIAGRLAATGKVDYLNVIVGSNYHRLNRMDHWPPTPAPHGLFVPLAAAIKQAVELPVFTTGRITDPHLAEAIVRDGKADMVGMTRAHIADPDLVAKLQDGRTDEIRPCVGANACISLTGEPFRCFHNPEAGREHDWGPPVPAAAPKTVAVIGGGPAGLEAARVAALRGHRVTLLERQPALGGQLRLWAAAPQTREFAKSVAWFESELRRLQVRTELSRTVSAEEMATLDADVIVLATGSQPRPRVPLPGEAEAELRIADPASVLRDPPDGIRRAVLRDQGGGRTGLAAAELLAERGVAVTVVTTEPAVAESVDPVIRTPLYRHLLESGATFRPNEEVARLDGRDVVLRNIYGAPECRLADVDLLVDWQGNRVVEDLLAAAEATDKDVHVIGDSVSPRTVHVAVAEGAMAGREI